MCYEFRILDGSRLECSYLLESYPEIMEIVTDKFFKDYYPEFEVKFDQVSERNDMHSSWNFTLCYNLPQTSLEDPDEISIERNKKLGPLFQKIAKVKSNLFKSMILKIMNEMQTQTSVDPYKVAFKREQPMWIVPLGN